MSSTTTDSTTLDAYEADDLLLSDLHIEVLRLWATTDKTHREIAASLDTSEDTVHKYVTRRLSKTEKAERQAEKAEATAEFLAAVEGLKQAK